MSAAMKENLQILFIGLVIISIVSIGAYSIWNTSYANERFVKIEKQKPQFPGEEQMMMYILDKKDNDVRVIGCPSGRIAGPSIYVISDPLYAAKVNPGDFTPVFYAKSENATAFYFAGWLSKEEVPKEEE